MINERVQGCIADTLTPRIPFRMKYTQSTYKVHHAYNTDIQTVTRKEIVKKVYFCTFS